MIAIMRGLQAGELRHDVARMIGAFQLLIGPAPGQEYPAMGRDDRRCRAGIGGQFLSIQNVNMGDP